MSWGGSQSRIYRTTSLYPWDACERCRRGRPLRAHQHPIKPPCEFWPFRIAVARSRCAPLSRFDTQPPARPPPPRTARLSPPSLSRPLSPSLSSLTHPQRPQHTPHSTHHTPPPRCPAASRRGACSRARSAPPSSVYARAARPACRPARPRTRPQPRAQTRWSRSTPRRARRRARRSRRRAGDAAAVMLPVLRRRRTAPRADMATGTDRREEGRPRTR